ncbi:MAG: preprotein translocase subunit YajC [Succinivibrionaceae bacterium]
MNFFPTALAEEVVTQNVNPNAQAPTGDMSVFVILAIVMLFMYLFVMRPNSKKRKEQQEQLNSLKVGDEVLTNGGIIGRIQKISDDKDVYTLEINETTLIKVKRTYIVSPLPKGTYSENVVVTKK